MHLEADDRVARKGRDLMGAVLMTFRFFSHRRLRVLVSSYHER
jgi:hypothetical protein